MKTEFTGDTLMEQRALTLHIGRAKSNVRSLLEASDAYRRYLDDECLGVRDAPDCKVSDGAKVIATVSYNGRVWAP